MKTIHCVWFAAMILMAATAGVNAQESNPKYHLRDNLKTAAFNVGGVCEMDKRRIENIALQTDGVKSAVWNIDSKLLTISYSSFKQDAADLVQKHLSAAGHDTPKYKAPELAYNRLPECCHYRK